jgi:hypothetical protein
MGSVLNVSIGTLARTSLATYMKYILHYFLLTRQFCQHCLVVYYKQCYFCKKEIGSGTHRVTQNSVGGGGGQELYKI